MVEMRSFALLFLATIIATGFTVSANAAKPVRPPDSRSYYLTKDTFPGDQVWEACADGYHFASMVEIENQSSMSYNAELGLTYPETGLGPPFYSAGGLSLRTGFVIGAEMSYGPEFPASEQNCLHWTSADSTQRGSAVGLWVTTDENSRFVYVYWRRALSSDASGIISIGLRCDSGGRVWCVSD